MTAEFWVTQTFNGISYGALLFLLASGLSLIFGVMRIVNLAHGSYFMLGGYVGLSVGWKTASFALALLAGAVAVALIGMGMERFFLRRLKGQTLGQVLMTIGFALIVQDLALLIWGGDPYTIASPSALSGSWRVAAFVFPIYRVFMVGVAVVVGLALWLLLDRTRVGAMVRAAVDDPEMAQGVGIHVPTDHPHPLDRRLHASPARGRAVQGGRHHALAALSNHRTRHGSRSPGLRLARWRENTARRGRPTATVTMACTERAPRTHRGGEPVRTTRPVLTAWGRDSPGNA